jgi:hypothetical protein
LATKINIYFQMAFRFGRKNAIPMMFFIEMAGIRAAK